MKFQYFWTTLKWYLLLPFRLFYDFYYNYGLTKAASLAYVFSANLVLFTYLLLSFNVFSQINPFHSVTSGQRFLEIHFLWPLGEQVLIVQAPPGFPLREGVVVSPSQLEQAKQEYKKKLGHPPKDLITKPYSITRRLAARAQENLREFQKQGQGGSVGWLIFLFLIIAYISLFLTTTASLAEMDTPLIRGNLPVQNRYTSLSRFRWYLPSLNTIRLHAFLLLALPTLSGFIIAGIFMFQIAVIDRIFPPYTGVNTALSLLISFFLILMLFFIFYKSSLSDISTYNLFLGAVFASSLWLAMRWFLTKYTAVSLETTLHNFVFVPLMVTWLYFFCAIFILGAQLSHILEYPYLTPVARSWIRRDAMAFPLLAILEQWVRLDFLLRLAHQWHGQGKEVFIRIGKKRSQSLLDVADEIASHCHLHPSFVRDVLLELLTEYTQPPSGEVKNRVLFEVVTKKRVKKQLCYLKIPPSQIDLQEVLEDEQRYENLLQEYRHYPLLPIFEIWRQKDRPMTLEEIYQIVCRENSYPLGESHLSKGLSSLAAFPKEKSGDWESSSHENGRSDSPWRDRS